jgi:hypothetical protein
MLAGGAMLAVPSGAAAVGASIQETLTSDGEGLMNVNSGTNPPGETWSWEVCDDAYVCTPFGSGRQLTTAGAAAEVRFEATSSLLASGFSRVWHGAVTSLGPPSVTGAVRANELVTPVPGQWAGGWEGDYDDYQLAACTDAAGADCVTLTDLHYTRGCPGGGAVIDPVFVGRHLRVADKRFGAESVFPAYAVESPYGGQTWLQRAETSVAMVGQIAAPAGRRTNQCGAPPLTKRAASITRRGYGFVRCGLGCRAVLVARTGSKRARVAADVHASFGSRRLRLRQGALADWQGAVTFVVKLDGKRAARRTLDLG